MSSNAEHQKSKKTTQREGFMQRASPPSAGQRQEGEYSLKLSYKKLGRLEEQIGKCEHGRGSKCHKAQVEFVVTVT